MDTGETGETVEIGKKGGDRFDRWIQVETGETVEIGGDR